ncbi:rhodanese-like domain-containing protein [Lactobacillus sp. PV034]|uniref:rhodanese-like domain-containing protein n=1 Tax=Lactobacillus sp. PV034 TaxID=2594495 RepID=UPI00223F766F|nr:rhodanese-like domain-containing protein [Lactobacillus sp. PV034]QNQ80903.1 rhodanese-like domain-containing protein [Lactobacillus sp. PV034]
MTVISIKSINQHLKNNPNSYLIDVRSSIEFATGHIPVSINFPLDELIHFNFPKHHSYLLICNTGRRAKEAYDYLKEKGYGNIFHIKENIFSWHGKLAHDF